jgi:hypothetical protein
MPQCGNTTAYDSAVHCNTLGGLQRVMCGVSFVCCVYSLSVCLSYLSANPFPYSFNSLPTSSLPPLYFSLLPFFSLLPTSYPPLSPFVTSFSHPLPPSPFPSLHPPNRYHYIPKASADAMKTVTMEAVSSLKSQNKGR